MKKFNNKSGFTLIEIIVVLIIVGILAAIALPNLFGNIVKSKSAQVLSRLNSLQTAEESCIAKNQVLPTEGTPASLCDDSIIMPALTGDLNVYASVVPATANLTTNLTYALTGTDPNVAANFVTMTRASDGGWTCAGSGSWSSAC